MPTYNHISGDSPNTPCPICALKALTEALADIRISKVGCISGSFMSSADMAKLLAEKLPWLTDMHKLDQSQPTHILQPAPIGHDNLSKLHHIEIQLAVLEECIRNWKIQIRTMRGTK